MHALSSHLSATFTRTSSNFWTSSSFADLSLFPSLICDFCPSDQEFAYSFHLTMDTLAVRLYTSSLPRRVRDFHPLERAHGAQTKCLHFKRKCRHHPHSILDILPVYLTRGISYHTAGGLFVFQSFVFQNNEKLHNVKQGLA